MQNRKRSPDPHRRKRRPQPSLCPLRINRSQRKQARKHQRHLTAKHAAPDVMPGGFVGLSGLANVGFRAHSVYAALDEELACGGWACFGRGGAGGVCALCTQHLARTDPAQHCQLVDLDRGGRASLCKLFFRRSTHVDLDPDRLCDRAVRDCDSVVFTDKKGRPDRFLCLFAAAVSLFLWWQTGSSGSWRSGSTFWWMRVGHSDAAQELAAAGK